jgi:hypothetical protein
MLFIGIAVLAVGPAIVSSKIVSPDREYNVVDRIDVGGNGKVHVVQLDKDNHAVVKCGPAHMKEAYNKEFKMMKAVESAAWSPKPMEFFMNKDSPCIVMDLLGKDLAKVRSNSKRIWPIELIASIGIQLIDAMGELHFTHNLVHNDLHAGNIALRLPAQDQLVVFDYGDMVPAVPSALIASELRQVMLTLRYLLDGDRKYYVTKRYKYNMEELCENIPEELCNVIDYAYSLDKEATQEDYREIRLSLEKMLAEKSLTYEGKIMWGKSVPAPAVPKFANVPYITSAVKKVTGEIKNESNNTTTTTTTTTKSSSSSITLYATIALVPIISMLI